MRKGFDGLSGLVREGLLKDPLSGDVFIPELPLESNTEVYLNCFSLSWKKISTTWILYEILPYFGLF